MRIILFKGASQYGGTRTFIDGLASAFARKGHDAEIIDIEGAPDPFAPILAAAERPADIVFSINIGGEARDARGRTLAEIFGGARHIVWHVDYILSQEERLAATPPDTTLLMVDPTQADALTAIYGAGRFPSTGFMPHAAVGEPAPDDPDPEAWASARPIQVLWSGGLAKPTSRPWDGSPKETQAVFNDAVDLALSVEWMPPHQALDAVLAARGLDIADPANQGARAGAKFVDLVVRVTRRWEFVKVLSKTGLPLHICGVGWEADAYRFKGATFYGAVPMTEVARMMRQARIVLNTNGNFGAGSHERPPSALLAGAAAFSDHSRFYANAFEAGELALFRWQALGEGMEVLKTLAQDTEAAFLLAQAGKARVLAGHTWDQRVGSILTT